MKKDRVMIENNADNGNEKKENNSKNRIIEKEEVKVDKEELRKKEH